MTNQFELVEENAGKLYTAIEEDLAKMYFGTNDLTPDLSRQWGLKYGDKFARIMEADSSLLVEYTGGKKATVEKIQALLDIQENV